MNIVAAAPLAAVAVPDADGGALAHVAGQALPYAHGVVPYAAGMVPPAAYAASPGEQLAQITPFLLDGALVTVQATLGGAVLATLLAFVTGPAALSRHRVVRAIARVYMEFFRGTSVIVQMFWIFFALPVLTGYRLAPLFAGILALGLNLGAYGSVVVRGGAPGRVVLPAHRDSVVDPRPPSGAYARPVTGRGRGQGARATRPGRAGRQGPRAPEPAVRWPATAGSHRPGAGDGAGDPAAGRGHLRPRPRAGRRSATCCATSPPRPTSPSCASPTRWGSPGTSRTAC